MSDENIGKPRQREPNFYERNRGRAVNLYGGVRTWSGDIVRYDEAEKMVILTKYIKRSYSADGTSTYIESPTEMELEIRLVGERELADREDRLGRIIQYNRNLRVEEAQAEQILNQSSKNPQRKKILNKDSKNQETQNHS